MERLTTEARDQLDPEVLPDGRLFFVAYENEPLGPARVHGRRPHRAAHGRGHRPLRAEPRAGWQPVDALPRVRRAQAGPAAQGAACLEGPVAAAEPRAARPAARDEEPHDATDYKPLARENIELGPILGFAGAGGGGFFGQLFASATDRLRNHAFMLSSPCTAPST